MPFQVFELRTRDTDQISVPVIVGPTKGQCLARDAQPTEATQSDQTPPLSIGSTFDNQQNVFSADNVFPLPIVSRNESSERFAKTVERIRRNQLMPYSVGENRPA
jgi:hypothetical protein